MAAPFTPAPWELSGLGIGKMVEGRYAWTSIATVDSDDPHQPVGEPEANARLIAAAPTLLKALRSALIVLDVAAKTTGSVAVTYEAGAVRAAIAEATGEAR